MVGVNGFIAITDAGWYTHLSANTSLTEVNFWLLRIER